MTTPALRGLYAITPDALCADPAALAAAVRAALRGGLRWLQYRDKQASAAQRRHRAAQLCRLCHDHGAGLIVNDDPALAAAVGADGVHLGRSDPAVSATRDQLGAAAIIGVSCGPSLTRAVDAAAAGASYLAFGRFFPSTTKPEAPAAQVELLGTARRRLKLPLCAIGGVTPANAAPLIAAGADLIAAVEGVFGSRDDATITAAVRAYGCLFVP